MIINPVETVEKDGQVRLQSVIEHSGKKETLWYSVAEKFAPYLTVEKADGFLVGMVWQAMLVGEDITVRGAVSERLYYNLTNYAMPILRLISPFLHSVRIHPDSLDDGSSYECEGGVVTGFSAGIDSFYTYYHHSGPEVPPSYRISHLVFNNVGSHGEWDVPRAEALFHERYELIRGFADEAGLDFIKINSNLSEVFQREFLETHVTRNASALLMLQKLVGKYLYSSDNRLQDTHLGECTHPAYAQPALVHLFSTETLDFVATGAQLTRVEKTRRVAREESATRWLNVCVAPLPDGGNCSSCTKCCRTLFTLELLGEIERFGSVFDMDQWRVHRKAFIVERVLDWKFKGGLTREIRDYIRETNYPLGFWYRFQGYLFSYLPRGTYQAMKDFYGFFLALVRKAAGKETGKAQASD